MIGWVLLLATAIAGPEMIPEAPTELLGRTAPLFEAPTFDGDSFSLEAARGEPVLLSFWASWCGPCRLELPALSAMQERRDDVTIYAVNVDRDRAKAEAFLRKLEVDLPIVWDNEAAALGQYNVMSMPTTFLVDAQGTVKFQKTGYSKENGLIELEAALDSLP